MARRKAASIPLSAIPAKNAKGLRFTDEAKRKAVAMLETRAIHIVSKKFGVSAPTLLVWQKAIDPTWMLKADLRRFDEERTRRLEISAMTVEREGAKGAALAREIRALAARHQSTMMGRK